MKQKLTRTFSLLKYPIAFGLLALLLRQIDAHALMGSVKNLSPWWLGAAFACFTFSQLFGVLRMNAYYVWHEKPIDFVYSLKLHYVALFYNIVLPGGIGGDGYKVLLLKKIAGYPAKQGVQIQLLTRTNGLLMLLLSMALSLPFVFRDSMNLMSAVAIVVAVGFCVTGYLYAFTPLIRAKRVFELRAMPYSIGVQTASIATMLCLWAGLGAPGDAAAYILLFQCAAIAGMIPITIGGLGLREFTFFYGASLIQRYNAAAEVDAETGVLISLLMFGVTLLSALLGMIWLGQMPRLAPHTGSSL